MTNPFRIALKVWLCLMIINLTAAAITLDCNIFCKIFFSLVGIAFLGTIIFWEKLTE